MKKFLLLAGFMMMLSGSAFSDVQYYEVTGDGVAFDSSESAASANL